MYLKNCTISSVAYKVWGKTVGYRDIPETFFFFNLDIATFQVIVMYKLSSIQY